MAMESTEFRRLVETHQRMVFSLALRVTGEYGAAEEVAQDAFLQLFGVLNQDSERLESEEHVRFWLRRVTVHRATDAVRRRSRQPEAEAGEWGDWVEAASGDGQAGPPLMPESGMPGSAALSSGMEARLEELLRALPEPLRVAVVLRYQEDMLPEEIAALLGHPVATVKSHLQRGLQLLRRKAAITMKEYVR